MVFDTEAERQAQIARVDRWSEWRAIPLDRIQAYRITYWAPDYAVVEMASAAPERRQDHVDDRPDRTAVEGRRLGS